eukprot:12853918-Prorocentrum_lima.AAC.1
MHATTALRRCKARRQAGLHMSATTAPVLPHRVVNVSRRGPFTSTAAAIGYPKVRAAALNPPIPQA